MTTAPAVDQPLQRASERALWMAWRETGDTRARAQLLDMHLPYAKVVAATYYGRRRHDEIEFDDYLQLASLALIEAAGRFDPDHGAQFRTFAAHRMHGAILDGIEQMTEKQQQIAARQRILAQRRDDALEFARETTGGLAPAEKALRLVAEAGLAFALGWLLEGTGLVEPEGEPVRELPFYASTELSQLRERIASLVRALPPQERRVIRDHYFQQVPFESIGAAMGLSKGRISQIHRSGLARLRDSLKPMGVLQDC